MVTVTHTLTLPDGRIIRATITARTALDRAPVAYEGPTDGVLLLATCAPVTLDALFQAASSSTQGAWLREQSQPWADEPDLQDTP